MSDAEAIAVYCRAFQAGVEALRSCEFQALLSQPLERGNSLPLQVLAADQQNCYYPKEQGTTGGDGDNSPPPLRQTIGVQPSGASRLPSDVMSYEQPPVRPLLGAPPRNGTNRGRRLFRPIPA